MPPNQRSSRSSHQPTRRIFDDFGSAYYSPGQLSVPPVTQQTAPAPIEAKLVHLDAPTSSLPESQPVEVRPVTAVRTKRFAMPLMFHSWQEFRIFAAGGIFALGLLSIGFYFGVSRPAGLAEKTGMSSGVQQITTDDGTVVEVDQGVNVDDVDHRPAPPIAGNMPRKLIIPSIGVNAQVRSLGLTKGGALAVPNYLSQVGWYESSAHPGEPGTVVMDGHFNGPDYAVFKKLYTLEPGAEINVERGDGEIITYVVESKEVFPKNGVPMDRLVGGDGQERLHIITCDGTWQNSQRTFDNRMIVFAKRKA